MRALSAALIVLSLAGAAWAQSPADALRAETKTFALAEIPDDYRAVTLGGGMDLTPWMLFGFASGGGNRGGSDMLLFRALGAIWVQPDEFGELLDGKRPRIRGYRLDLGALVGSGPNARPTFVESWLETGRIQTWSAAPELSKAALTRAFAEATGGGGTEVVAAESAEMVAEESAAPSSSSPTARLSAVKNAAVGVMMYAADNRDRFPRATSSAALKPMIAPYLKSARTLDPTNESGRLLYNTYLTGETLSSLPAPAATLLLWEERAWADGKRAVAFADGHAVRVDGARWSKIWRDELARRDAFRARNKRAR